MPKEKEYLESKRYLQDLRNIRSEVHRIINDGSEKEMSRAAQHYPGTLNYLLVSRNIKNLRVIVPFFELALLKERNPELSLLDLNIDKDAVDLLWDVIRRIDQEFEEN
jgi:hypothetical protein